jgi:predicted KAP-like P-loop ATPase
MAYTDKEINDLLGLAQEVGITRAMRELGYPKAWSTVQYWAEKRGITIAPDELRAKAAATREWYKDEELKTVAQLGLDRITEDLIHNKALSPDDQKKLSEAYQKYVNTLLTLQGKATDIKEHRQTDTMDEHLNELLNMELAKNAFKGGERITDNALVA